MAVGAAEAGRKEPRRQEVGGPWPLARLSSPSVPQRHHRSESDCSALYLHPPAPTLLSASTSSAMEAPVLRFVCNGRQSGGLGLSLCFAASLLGLAGKGRREGGRGLCRAVVEPRGWKLTCGAPFLFVATKQEGGGQPGKPGGRGSHHCPPHNSTQLCSAVTTTSDTFVFLSFLAKNYFCKRESSWLN